MAAPCRGPLIFLSRSRTAGTATRGVQPTNPTRYVINTITPILGLRHSERGGDGDTRQVNTDFAHHPPTPVPAAALPRDGPRACRPQSPGQAGEHIVSDGTMMTFSCLKPLGPILLLSESEGRDDAGLVGCARNSETGVGAPLPSNHPAAMSRACVWVRVSLPTFASLRGICLELWDVACPVPA